jgi:hypothetical protein
LTETLSSRSQASAKPKEATGPTLEDLQKMKDEKKLVAWVIGEHQNMRESRARQKLIWDLNLAFYFGNQYLELTPLQGGRLTLPKAPPYRVRLVVNRVKPVVRTEVARLTSQKPSASVVPASSEDSDLAAAYAAEQLWESISLYNKLHRIYRQAAFWQSVCGNGFIKVWYDTNAKDHASEEPGAVQYAAVTPYHLFVPDLRTEDIQNQPYVLNLYTMPVARAKAQYAKQLEGRVLNPTDTAAQDIVSDAVLNLNAGGKSEKDSVLVYEMWIKPNVCEHVPKGGMVTVVGDVLVAAHTEGIPYNHGEFPFVKFDHIPTGKFYSDSAVTDIVPIQREYNRTRSQITEAKNRMAKPQLLAPKGSVDASKITTEPGQIIYYRPGMAPPQPLPLQPLPAYVSQDLDRSLMDIEDITGQHQVSRGGVPPGVTAATAISYLQEKDDSILSTAYASVEEGMEDIARQTLYLVKQFWDMQRTVKVVGADGSFDVLQLAGADICTDIRMEGGSALPVSKSARQAFLMDLMKMGFVPPDMGLKLMDIGGVQQLNRQMQIDENQAKRENIRMKMLDPMQVEQYQQQAAMQAQMQMQQMQMDPEFQQMAQDPSFDPSMIQPPPPEPMIPVNSWDDHGVHVQVHNNFRKTQAFEMLPDSIKAEFEAHVETHMAAIGDAMQQAQEYAGMGAAAGIPGAPDSGAAPDSGGAPPEMGAPPMPGGMQ